MPKAITRNRSYDKPTHTIISPTQIVPSRHEKHSSPGATPWSPVNFSFGLTEASSRGGLRYRVSGEQPHRAP
ncbi:hypothetical protein M407DRAFT_241163 [Tulasnella calospora MUT 4182]|uniref:Uncharacterized protein n=1 Tax=Tulasnella calospora MUT 4182 TaxID=1051891 RepID=A0A0C3QKP8_9AGAM|nr:hypothetical protein M407DRAFT_241163 [Tulasnella calospora MUT 4182]